MPLELEASHAYEVVAVTNERIVLRNPWNHQHPEPMSPAEFRANLEPAYTTLK